MTKYKVLMSKQAKEDRDKIKTVPALQKKVDKLIELVSGNPFSSPPSYEKLFGKLQGLYSRRINKQHRLVYEVREEEKTIIIFRMWTHYE